MGATRNSFLFSRVAVWLSAGSVPSVTIACSTFRIKELSYRTSPTNDQLISRRVSRTDHLQTIPIDRPMLDRIRCALSRLSASVRGDADPYLMQDRTGSNWFFQPRQDGWFAMFDGKPNEVHAFQQWLSEILI